jgi:hypothetical protein
MDLQPVTKTDEGFFNTVSGIKVNLLAPTVEMISIVDIASALSKICRFGGHSRGFYSVAQHTMLVEFLAPESLKQVAFLHDFSEAYVGDMIKPLKHIVGNSFDEVEDRFMKAIFKKFSCDISLLPLIKPYDTAALIVEHDFMWQKNEDMRTYFEYRMGILRKPFWNPELAEALFIKRFKELFKD